MYLVDIIKKYKNFIAKKDNNKIKWKKNINFLFKKQKQKKKLILIITIGRSGSRWLLNIFKSHKNEFSGATERDIIYESFYHFCSYHKLKIDQKPFLLNLKNRILEDWSKSKTSVICSPYYVFGLKKIIKEIRPNKIILCLNDPIFTANSFLNKGWYKENFTFTKNFKIIGLQPYFYNSMSHYFGRIIPSGRIFTQWNKMSRIGKVGWYMNSTMKSVYKVLKKQKQKIFIFNLDISDQNYEFYLLLRKKFNIKLKLSKKNFLNLKKTKATTPSSNDLSFNNLDQSRWSRKDKLDFNKQTVFFKKFYLNNKKYLKFSEKII